MIMENQKNKIFKERKLLEIKIWIEELHFKHRGLLQPTAASERAR
jgi:hypothetical protein